MTYGKIVGGRFISRPNRFIAQVETNGEEHTVHVKNTGRCRELLIPGCTVYLEESDKPGRRTKYDLVSVIKETKYGSLLINMDSQCPNKSVEEWVCGSVFPKDCLIRREVTYENSRFDLYAEWDGRKAFLEVKGVTLEQDGVAMFPDAPTERGTKHLRELADCVAQGYDAYVLFVIQMKGVRLFRPNRQTDPKFADALKAAADAGVHILAYDCRVTPNSMELDAPVKVEI